MLVRMLTLAAGPEMILEAGKVYNLPKTQAMEFIKGGYAKVSDGSVKPTRVPPQPDPEDVPEVPDEEELTEGDSDE